MKVNESLDSRQAESEAEEREFIAEQLLKIVSGYDLSDNAGKNFHQSLPHFRYQNHWFTMLPVDNNFFRSSMSQSNGSQINE